jgi:hypothetical protein
VRGTSGNTQDEVGVEASQFVLANYDEGLYLVQEGM